MIINIYIIMYSKKKKKKKALYEKFWERYARYLASQGNVQDATNIFMKAINIFIPPQYVF